jgi:catechol O-methyltransferase
MTIGHFKGDMIVKEIKKHNPKVGVELGTYIGYSAVKFGQHFKERGDGHYYCVEYDPIMAAVATQVIISNSNILTQ